MILCVVVENDENKGTLVLPEFFGKNKHIDFIYLKKIIDFLVLI